MFECDGMLLGWFLKHIYLIMHRSYYKIVLTLFIIFWLFLCSISRTFRCLRTFVVFLWLVLDFAYLLSFHYLASLEVSWSDYRFPAERVFTTKDWQLDVICFVEIGIFGSFPNRGSGESFFVSKLDKKWNKKELKGITARHSRLLFSYSVL